MEVGAKGADCADTLEELDVLLLVLELVGGWTKNDTEVLEVVGELDEVSVAGKGAEEWCPRGGCRQS